MSVIKFDEVKKSWYEVSKYTAVENPTFEIEIHKRLIDIFHVGDFYYYIFHVGGVEMEFVSEGVKKVLGIASTDIFTIDYLLSHIHPEDLPYFVDFEERVNKFFTEIGVDKVMKYKTSYDYRVRKPDGTYVRILQQNVTIHTNEAGAIIRSMGVHTDITHLKKTNGSTLSFIGLEGEPSFHDVCKGLVSYQVTKSNFTKMELKVLAQLVKGLTSKQIGDILFISKLTVDGHRKNMLKKTNCNNTIELILNATQYHWVDGN